MAHSFVWRRDGRRLLGPTSFDVTGPGLLLVHGPNGSGKSSLLRAMAGLLVPMEGGVTSGDLLRDGRPPEPTDAALVPQDPLDGLLASTAQQEFRLRMALGGTPARVGPALAAAALNRAGLDLRRDVPVTRLSAGEMRRLTIEAALVSEPGLLLVDEPLDHLHRRWRRWVLDRLVQEAGRRRVVVATSGPTPWKKLADAKVPVSDNSEGAALRPVVAPPAARNGHHPCIEMRNVALEVSGQRLLSDATAALGPGIHLLLGDNGSGKTTLLRTLFGFEKPAAGTVRLDGVDPARDGPGAASAAALLLFEHPSRMFFSATVHDEVVFGNGAESAAETALARVGLSGLAGQSPFKLSRGQKERLALALLAARDRPVLLLDEPTAGLDRSGLAGLVDLLSGWRADRCVLVATQDERLLASADSCWRIEDGRLSAITDGRGVEARRPS